MPIPEFLEKWGDLIVQNPIVFIVFAIMGGGLTGKISQIAYSAQMGALRGRLLLAEDKLTHATEVETSAGSLLPSNLECGNCHTQKTRANDGSEQLLVRLWVKCVLGESIDDCRGYLKQIPQWSKTKEWDKLGIELQD